MTFRRQKHYAADGTRSVPATLLLVLLVATSSLSAQTLMPRKAFDEQHILQPGVETPHTKWAKPYARDPVRVLYFCHSHQFTPRMRIIEMTQRFDIEAESVYESLLYAGGFLKRVPQVLGRDMGRARMVELMEEEFDCYVLVNGFLVDLLPAEVRYKILKRVSEGAGLIVIPDTESNVDFLPDELKDSQPPVWLADLTELTTYSIGQGRAAVFNDLAELLPDVIGAAVQIDYRIERIGRLMLWASGREPELRLRIEAPATLEQSKLTEMRGRLHWPAREGRERIDARLRLRSASGREWALKGHHLKREGGQGEFSLPRVPAGLYFVEALASGESGVHTWATHKIEITSPVGLRLEYTDDKAYERGEPITGQMRIVNVENPQSFVTRLETVDAHGRILYRHDQPAEGKLVPFSIPTFDGARRSPAMVRLAATLYSKGDAVQTADRHRKRGVFHGDYVSLTNRHHGQFNFLVWGKTYNQNFRPYVSQYLADFGVTAQLARYPDWESTAGGLSWVPYATGIKQRMDENGRLTPASWNHEEDVNAWVEKVVNSSRRASFQGSLVYNLGDENDTFGADFSPEDLAAYRRYLAKDFESIDELNEVWGSSFASFDEITLSKADDLTETTSLLAGNYPRWWSRRRFMRYNYAMLVGRFQKAFEEIDPHAKAGFEGAGWMDDDIDLLSKQVKFWAPYSHLTMQVISSITEPDLICGQWSTNWDLALHGGRMFGWFRMDNEGAVHGSLLAADGSLRPMHKYAMETRQVWLHGLGTAMIHWDRLDDGVVMLYSFPSSTATHIASGISYRSMGQVGEETESNHACWHTNLRAAHLQAKYITAAMIDRGEWTGGGKRALILSQSEALSPRQVEVIREFVRGGGTVIAGTRPGIYNHRMQVQEQGLLDDLFGVRHLPAAAAEKRDVDVDWHYGGHEIHGTIPDQLINPALQLTDGEAQGWAKNTPVFIVKELGRGRAILLNLIQHPFPQLNDPEASPVARQTFAAMLKAAGLRPTVHVRDENGVPLPDVEVARWREGSDEVIALHRRQHYTERDAPAPRPIFYELDRPRVVTDVRTGVSRPAASTHFANIRKGEPLFLLLTDSEPQPPRVSAPESITRGHVLKFQVDLASAGLRTLRVTATNPEGGNARWFRRVVKVTEKQTHLEFMIAYNEQTGPWQFVFTDAVSGKSTGVSVKVE